MIKSIDDLKDNDRLAIEEFRKRMTDLFGNRICSLILFGSKISGADSEYSDIDIFITAKDCDSEMKDKIIDIAFDVNLAYGVYISPRVVPLKLFNNKLFRCTPFLQHIENEGLKL